MKIWKSIRHNFGLIIGILIVASMAIVAIAAPKIAPPEDPEDPYSLPVAGYGISPKPPSEEYRLGLMENQGDIFYGLIWGTRGAFIMSLAVAVGRALIGVLVGVISGYYGRVTDSILMRITDAFLAFPLMAAVLVMITLFGGGLIGIQTGGAEQVILIALIVFGWMQHARLIRGNVLAEKTQEYVQAAITLGANSRRIIFKHILPNTYQGLLVLISSDIGSIVVWMAVFSFLGFSGTQPTADWGKMVSASRNWIISAPETALTYWYTFVPPSLVIILFSFAWNLVGDGLRDLLDPRISKNHRT
jgi:peptide/nickel transport system permease protein